MSLISTGSFIRNSYLSTLHDICSIGNSASTVNTFGEPSEEIVYSGSKVCGLFPNGGIKSFNGQYFKTESDATLRLPMDTDISASSIVKVTSIYDTSASLVYRVNSEPKQGIAGIVVELKRVVV